MCERGSGSLEEKINGESVIITEKEIVERFTHESTAVPYLKGSSVKLILSQWAEW